ncbi:MAG: NAD(P)H-binding protein [Chlorobiaceae bacterium]|nr:NAD(P)H-binding protein [Chlorobiaceae bacterium]
MHYVITGSLGNIGKPLATQLVQAGHSVTVVSSKAERIKAIEAIGAKAAIGSVSDTRFLTEAFTGADGVFTMVPPNFEVKDWKGYIGGIGRNYVIAIRASEVKQVVNLSSIGAHMREGCGPVSGLYRVEQAFDDLHGVNVRHLRAGYFYTNFLASITSIKDQGMINGNFGEKTLMVLVHPADIADEAALELTEPSFLGKGFRYIVSDEKTTDEVAAILGQAIGRPDLQWVDRSDTDMYDAMIRSWMPEEIARNYVEMGAAMRSGQMIADYEPHRPVIAGWRSLDKFAPEFAAAFAALKKL